MAEQLPLEHQSQRKRFLACCVTTLWHRLGTIEDTSLASEKAYACALKSSVGELEEMRRTLEAEVADKKRAEAQGGR